MVELRGRDYNEILDLCRGKVVKVGLLLVLLELSGLLDLIYVALVFEL